MMKTRILSTIAAAFLLAQMSPAGAAQTAFGVTVKRLVVMNDGGITVQFSGNICDDSGAAAKDWGHSSTSVAGTTADGVKSILSTLQAAKLSGATVVIRTSSFNWGCNMIGVDWM